MNRDATRPSREEAFEAFCTLLAYAAGQRSESTHPELVTAETISTTFPGLTARAFSDAGRRGEFAAFKSGRKLAARHADVAAWLETRRVEPRGKRTPATIDPEVEYVALAQRGVQ